MGWVASVAVVVAIVGVFLTWTSVGSASLDGTQGPNNGWLVVIVAAFALGWIRAMARGSWIGVLGVFGASVVMFWTSLENWLDNRDVLDGAPGLGLFLVLLSAVALGACAVVRGLHVARHGARRPTASA
jgi:divalent metal cation (Fe/Co/Zn/Cd) transporter